MTRVRRQDEPGLDAPRRNRVQGGRRRLSVLIYHRVLANRDPLVPSALTRRAFRWQARLLSRYFNMLPMDEAVERLQDDTLPPNAATITFDDGYADCVRVALPVLLEFGLPATFFVATGYLNGGWMWNDRLVEALRMWSGDTLDLTADDLGVVPMATLAQRRAALQSLQQALKEYPLGDREAIIARIERGASRLNSGGPMMTDEQIRLLGKAGMGLGAHTVTHPILTQITPDEARAEMSGARACLENLVQRPVRHFAYPNGIPGGDYDGRHVEMARAIGFRSAFSTAWGVADSASDLYQLPRFTPWDASPARFMLRHVLNRRRTDYALA
jgi:peptidoglycan/xylan/chitin deacetylase (PgdA/CDA1 family)